jgi:hypothetical protein
MVMLPGRQRLPSIDSTDERCIWAAKVKRGNHGESGDGMYGDMMASQKETWTLRGPTGHHDGPVFSPNILNRPTIGTEASQATVFTSSRNQSKASKSSADGRASGRI